MAPFDRGILRDVFEGAWQALALGVRRRTHPFHLGILATTGAAGPAMRTVVLRDVSRERTMLTCHTDRRSRKVAEITNAPRVAWLFYDAQAKRQLRLDGTATVHCGDPVARSRWESSKLSARRCYLAPHPPGQALVSPGAHMPPHLEARAPMKTESEAGFAQFCVICCKIDRVDWLELDAHGHQRAHFSRTQDGWQARWVAP